MPEPTGSSLSMYMNPVMRGGGAAVTLGKAYLSNRARKKAAELAAKKAAESAKKKAAELAAKKAKDAAVKKGAGKTVTSKNKPKTRNKTRNKSPKKLKANPLSAAAKAKARARAKAKAEARAKAKRVSKSNWDEVRNAATEIGQRLATGKIIKAKREERKQKRNEKRT
jgi:hypothetical protein